MCRNKRERRIHHLGSSRRLLLPSASHPADSRAKKNREKRSAASLNVRRTSATSVSVKVKANKTETVNVALQSRRADQRHRDERLDHSSRAREGSESAPHRWWARPTNTKNTVRGAAPTRTSSGQYTISGLGKRRLQGRIQRRSSARSRRKEKQECPEVYVTQYYHGKQTHKQAETIAVTTGSNTGRDQRKPARSVPDDAGQHRRAGADGDGGRRSGADLLAGLLVARTHLRRLPVVA